MTEYVLAAIKSFVTWFLDLVLTAVDDALAPILPLIPDLSGGNIFDFITYLSWANKWLAIDYGFTLLIAYFAIATIIIIIKWIISIIPGM